MSRWLALNSRAGDDAGGPNPPILHRGERHDPESGNTARHGSPFTQHQREAMRDKTRSNAKPAPSGGNRTSGARKSETAGRNTPGSTPPQHTDAQRERMQEGLRILARMIVRAHLRREALGDPSAPPTDQGNGGGAACGNGGPPASTTPNIPPVPNIAHRHNSDAFVHFPTPGQFEVLSRTPLPIGISEF